MKNYKAPFLSASFEKSSNLREAEYDPFMRVLSLTFRNGSTYDFLDVDKKLFFEMKKADSVGKFFHKKIRGKYDFLKKGNKPMDEQVEKEHEESDDISNNIEK